jgi:hypothetical protein
MNKRMATAPVAALICGLLLAGIALTASASTAQDYGIPWWTVDDGGGRSTSGSYVLVGTIGQPDAGAMSGGDYGLAGGFWGGRAAVGPGTDHFIYLPVILRQ